MSSFIIRYRWIIISACIAAGLFFIFLIPLSRTDPEIRNYIPADLPLKKSTDSIEQVFGFQDMMMILYSDSCVVTSHNLGVLRDLGKKLSQINGISSIISPLSIKTIRSEEGVMIAERLVGKVPEGKNDEEKLKSEMAGKNFSRDIVFSPDLKTAALTFTLSSKRSESTIIDKIDSAIIATDASEKILTGGLPVIRRLIMQDVRRDAVLIVPAALLIMFLILRITLGSWRSVYIPVSVVVLSTGISIGLIPLLGWKISIITLLVPVIMIAVANNYGIYLVSYYNRLAEEGVESKHELLNRLAGSLKMPVMFSGLTTIAGILGLLAHSIIPARQVGILAATGVSIALIMSLLMVPALLTVNNFSGSKGKERKKIKDGMDGFFLRLATLLTRYPGRILVISAIIIALFASGISMLRIDTNQEHFFPAGHRLRKASVLINENFGGSQTISVMISGDIRDPEVMKGIDRLTRRLEEQKGTGRVFSISHAVREMSKALYESNEEGYDKIPETKEAIAQMFELYYMSGDEDDFKQLINPENDKAHILVRIFDPSDKVIKELTETIKEEGKNIPARLTTGGYALIMHDFTGSLIRGQVFSLVFAMVTVFVLLAIIFRSVKGGLTGTLPLAASVIVLFGFMGFTGIAIDPATALLSSVMIGVGVDFTIQYMWRFNSELMECGNYATATERSLKSIGQSIVINALTVMAGFSALIFSGFTSIKFFGYLVVISIGSCLLASLFVIPAFLLKFRPLFIEANLTKKKYGKDEKKKSFISAAHALNDNIGPAA